jgi:hypothetical protein
VSDHRRAREVPDIGEAFINDEDIIGVLRLQS